MNKFSDAIDATAHPRPLLRRAWQSLDGEWLFHADAERKHDSIGSVSFDSRIQVPFAPESPASGIGTLTGLDRVWYRRDLQVDAPAAGHRLLLHFGAVDRDSRVWVNGSELGRHVGGYDPFSVDVTEQAEQGTLEIGVSADDDPRALNVPRGKQDWEDVPHRIWYPRTTGIWRAVWLEQVPQTRIDRVDYMADPASMTLTVTVEIAGPIPRGLRLGIRIGARGRVLVDDDSAVADRTITRTVSIGDGGIDDRAALVWTPASPNLLDVDLRLAQDDREVDRAASYTAMRSIDVHDGRFLLNGRPTTLLLALDQGYWPETGATPPDSAALRRDLELARALGFNGVRKHQKTEDPRFFAWADRLGMLAWVEMPSAYAPGATTAAALLSEWTRVVEAYRGHPSVIAWVPINESWGVPNLANDPTQRALAGALAAAAHALDGTRPVSTNDGWETFGGDILGIHDYTQDADLIRARYGTRAATGDFLRTRRADGRLPELDAAGPDDRAVVLSEFGGVALGPAESPGAWGYDRVRTPDDLVDRYRSLWRAVHESDVLVGGCWTQLTDTYQEVNGLLTFDRVPKADPAVLAAATRGE